MQLRRNSATQQTNQIVAALGALAQQKRDQYKEVRREKDDAAKEYTVKKMMGANNLRRLLMMTQAPNEAQLKTSCRFYSKIAEVLKAQRLLGVLESKIQTAMESKGHQQLSFPTSMGLLSNLLTLQLQWHRVHEDSMTRGIL